ncbi:ATP-binding protein [Roseiconus lacunae]|uniref:sensor histidine kinase n=1 Tax=Roseiconus lacunae TaxID=2605694 RepID=UPI0030876A3C|nr:ATP-binding protein [Stieleria sp. HD01]
MKVLLVDPNDFRRRKWRERLEKANAKVIAMANLPSLSITARFTMGFLAWPVNSRNPEDWIADSKTKCGTLVGIFANNVDSAGTAYAAGLDDYLSINCTDSELFAKMARAEQLELTQQRLSQAQKLEAIGELASGIAHEINTPIQYVGDNTRFVESAFEDLVSVLQVCQTLIGMDVGQSPQSAIDALRETMDEADVDYLLDEIPTAITQTLEGVDRVASIVRAMKDFAHPGVSEMTQVDLTQSIENTMMVARNEWKYVAEIETKFDANLPPVPCLPGELNQVLLNLIINAAHAVADKVGETTGQKGTITIATHHRPPCAEIVIRDSGSGIARENLERIFAPFFTTKPVGKGTGQGLAIAHSVIVDRHGGTIDVDSQIGKGTAFTIRLPLDQNGPDGAPPASTAANTSHRAPLVSAE